MLSTPASPCGTPKHGTTDMPRAILPANRTSLYNRGDLTVKHDNGGPKRGRLVIFANDAQGPTSRTNKRRRSMATRRISQQLASTGQYAAGDGHSKACQSYPDTWPSPVTSDTSDCPITFPRSPARHGAAARRQKVWVKLLQLRVPCQERAGRVVSWRVADVVTLGAFRRRGQAWWAPGAGAETLSLVSTGAAGADGTQACEGASKEDPGYGLLGRCRKRLACHRFF
ncbi:hypothetical protein EV126DRAFT_440275 [Verticillium dahliae]|nr:hypothetical protein EV126DRAFT_440275 [Verticillium dahliae]